MEPTLASLPPAALLGTEIIYKKKYKNISLPFIIFVRFECCGGEVGSEGCR